MDITRLDPTAAPGASSAFAPEGVAKTSSTLSFADLLKSQTKQAEVSGASAMTALLNRGAAAIAPASEVGVIRVQPVAPTEEAVVDAASNLREWGGASRSKKARNGESPLALSAHDSSLAGRYDVVARREDSEERGARHSLRA
jgi:hypothetical protein